MTPTIDDYRWLISDAAQQWLDHARIEIASAGGATTALLSHLRKDLSAAQAHLVVEQCELRQRAAEKFSRADNLFFTRQGLEQATDESLAVYKAGRFPAGVQIDLCCGIGGDLMALAARGPARGIDTDPVAALLAGANSGCAVFVQDAMDVPLAGSAWHCDPDRRTDGRRTTRGDLFQPPLAALESLLQRAPNAAIKLAPATIAPAHWSDAAELEWLGSRGECRQQVAWFGSQARHVSQHCATIVDAEGGPRTIVGASFDSPPPASQLGRYVYEPHATILAAKLTAAVCRQHALAPLSARIAYLTSDTIVSDPALDSFEVLDVLPFDRKQLKAYCRDHRIGRLEIKKRGVEFDPAKLRKEIVSDGDGEATLIISPISDSMRAIVARRIGGR